MRKLRLREVKKSAKFIQLKSVKSRDVNLWNPVEKGRVFERNMRKWSPKVPFQRGEKAGVKVRIKSQLWAEGLTIGKDAKGKSQNLGLLTDQFLVAASGPGVRRIPAPMLIQREISCD